jgi:hypothetical protein
MHLLFADLVALSMYAYELLPYISSVISVPGNLEISVSSELGLLFSAQNYFAPWLFIRLLPAAFASPPLGKNTEPDSSFSSRHMAGEHVCYPILRHLQSHISAAIESICANSFARKFPVQSRYSSVADILWVSLWAPRSHQ